jgi:hypothetical protein
MKRIINVLIYFVFCVYLMVSVMSMVSSQSVISKYKQEVKTLNEEKRVLMNEVQLRENEISYWGMKYDSIVNTNTVIE